MCSNYINVFRINLPYYRTFLPEFPEIIYFYVETCLNISSFLTSIISNIILSFNVIVSWAHASLLDT